MLNHFRTYKIAVEFHHRCRSASLPDWLRFFHMALGSLRESQAALDLAPKRYPELISLADSLGAHLYRLCHSKHGR